MYSCTSLNSFVAIRIQYITRYIYTYYIRQTWIIASSCASSCHPTFDTISVPQKQSYVWALCVSSNILLKPEVIHQFHGPSFCILILGGWWLHGIPALEGMKSNTTRKSQLAQLFPAAASATNKLAGVRLKRNRTPLKKHLRAGHGLMPAAYDRTIIRMYQKVPFCTSGFVWRGTPIFHVFFFIIFPQDGPVFSKTIHHFWTNLARGCHLQLLVMPLGNDGMIEFY